MNAGAPRHAPGAPPPDGVDRALVRATQAGLPLTPEPYRAIAEAVGIGETEAIERLVRMVETGAIRRIGAVPNHYALGYRANAMTVWDVDDDRIGALGRRIGALTFVSHCYRRPRHGPEWPYNLFAMVHGRTRGEVEDKASEIGCLLGAAAHGHDLLYSTRILKKTGLRIGGARESETCSG